jgi:hypothetical protein
MRTFDQDNFHHEGRNRGSGNELGPDSRMPEQPRQSEAGTKVGEEHQGDQEQDRHQQHVAREEPEKGLQEEGLP